MAYTWSDIWNHDVQFGFTCGAFAMFFGMVLLYLLCELVAWLAVGRKQQEATEHDQVIHAEHTRHASGTTKASDFNAGRLRKNVSAE